MAKINRELLDRLKDTEKVETVFLDIDGEAFELKIQKNLTTALQDKAVKFISEVSSQFVGENELENLNYLIFVATIFHTLTDLEIPTERSELILFIGDLMMSGLSDKIIDILGSKASKALTQFSNLILGMAKVVEDGSLYTAATQIANGEIS